MSLLAVVDGPNFISDVGRVLSRIVPSTHPETGKVDWQRAFYRDWFDIDRLVQATLMTKEFASNSIHPLHHLGIVIFRTRQEVGDKTWCIKANQLDSYWARQGSNPGSSVMLVDIPGAPGSKDRDVDMSMAVYLFETADSWDSTVLFTNDSDFVPVVWSLKRRGKHVFCSSHIANDVARPLVQACQHFFPWDTDFLRADWELFELLQPGGTLDVMLARPQIEKLQPRVIFDGEGIELHAGVSGFREDQDNLFNGDLGHTLFYAKRRSSDSMKLMLADPTRDRRDGVVKLHNSYWVMEGVIRHRELFRDAKWFAMQ